MNHYTNRKGFNAIRATPEWVFLARKPPGNHPRGAYFTTLAPDTRKLAKKLLIPKSKTEYVFPFADIGDLKPLAGGRGAFVFYSPTDYRVGRTRQGVAGRV